MCVTCYQALGILVLNNIMGNRLPASGHLQSPRQRPPRLRHRKPRGRPLPIICIAVRDSPAPCTRNTGGRQYKIGRSWSPSRWRHTCTDSPSEYQSYRCSANASNDSTTSSPLSAASTSPTHRDRRHDGRPPQRRGPRPAPSWRGHCPLPSTDADNPGRTHTWKRGIAT